MRNKTILPSDYDRRLNVEVMPVAVCLQACLIPSKHHASLFFATSDVKLSHRTPSDFIECVLTTGIVLIGAFADDI